MASVLKRFSTRTCPRHPLWRDTQSPLVCQVRLVRSVEFHFFEIFADCRLQRGLALRTFVLYHGQAVGASLKSLEFLAECVLGKRVDYVSVGQTVAKHFVKPVDCEAGGEGGIRARPFFE